MSLDSHETKKFEVAKCHRLIKRMHAITGFPAASLSVTFMLCREKEKLEGRDSIMLKFYCRSFTHIAI